MYDTVFAIEGMPTYWWAPVAVLGGVLLGFVLLKMQRRPAVRAFAWFIMILSVTWALAASWFVSSDWWVLRGVYQRGDYRVVEGIIEDFRAMPSTGKGRETFRVDAVDFSVSDFDMTSGFHTTTYRLGPLREGLPVRIAYYPSKGRNVILRLEVMRGTNVR
jgi:hypothetical protein